MDSEATDLNKWFSSYGLMTAERILERFQLKPSHQVILQAAKTPDSFYHLLLLVPVQNVMNGIILEQAKDYHLYIQKMFIDYLMSGEDNKTEDSPGANTRDSIEDMRQSFLQQAEIFDKIDRRHARQIAASQKEFIKYVSQWRKSFDAIIQLIYKESGKKLRKKEIKDCLELILADTSIASFAAKYQQRLITNLNIDPDVLKIDAIEMNLEKFIASFEDLQTIITKYSNEAISLRTQLKTYRQLFYDSILQISETMSYLSDFYLDDEQVKMNKEALDFDTDVI